MCRHRNSTRANLMRPVKGVARQVAKHANAATMGRVAAAVNLPPQPAAGADELPVKVLLRRRRDQPLEVRQATDRAAHRVAHAQGLALAPAENASGFLYVRPEGDRYGISIPRGLGGHFSAVEPEVRAHGFGSPTQAAFAAATASPIASRLRRIRGNAG